MYSPKLSRDADLVPSWKQIVVSPLYPGRLRQILVLRPAGSPVMSQFMQVGNSTCVEIRSSGNYAALARVSNKRVITRIYVQSEPVAPPTGKALENPLNGAAFSGPRAGYKNTGTLG